MKRDYYPVDHVPRATLELSEKFVPKLPSPAQARYHGVREYGRAATARADGAARRVQQAHDDLAAIESQKGFRVMILKAGQFDLTQDELAEWDGKIDRARKQVEAANSASAAASKEASAARDVANRTALYLAQLAMEV